MELIESWAMPQTAGVSGLLLLHPQSRDFTVGRIGADQVEDYARRRSLTRAETERRLRPDLGYEPS